MDTKPLIGVCILAVVLLMLGSLTNVVGYQIYNIGKQSSSKGNWLFVGGSGPGNYTRIQSAINDANPKDTIFVYNGMYYEHVVVNKTIDLIGEDKDTTVIDGGRTEDVVYVPSNEVTISGFTIRNGGSGIYLGSSSSNNTIIGNDVNSNDFYGIKLCLSSNNTIKNNNVINNYCGILVGSSNNNMITDNNASNNGAGIVLGFSSNNTVIGNNANSNIYYGISLEFSNNSIITSNNAFNNGRGIKLSSSNNNTIRGNNVYSNVHQGIELFSSNNNMIIGSNARSNGDGIYLYSSSNNTVTGNNVSYNSYGIFLIESGYNTIRGNNASKNVKGIILDFSYNIIMDNKANSNSQFGIQLFSSSNNTVVDNDASRNEYGIYLSESSYNTIKDNYVNSNADYGIILLGSSDNNRLYHNTLINNPYNGCDEGNNTWNSSYPFGGNYWSDYYGIDNYTSPNQDRPGSDGIGDTPYDLPCEHAMDWYPLMLPYSMTTLTLTIQPDLFHLSLIIKNVGNTTAFNAQWSRTIVGFVLFGKETSGVLPKNLIPGEEKKVTSDNILIGFGRIKITATAQADNAPVIIEEITGILFLFFFKVLKD